MATAADSSAAPVLDASERVAEIMFGLIMALTFTGTIEVTMADREEVVPILVAALGCNIAWGLVDGVMYVVQQLVERGRTHSALLGLSVARDEAAMRAILARDVPQPNLDLVALDDLPKLREVAAERIAQLRVGLTAADFRAAFAVCVLVVVATFPVVVPYFVFDDVAVAKRVSNLVSILMLYGCGHALGRHAGVRPVRTGLAMVAIGIVLVLSIMALGG